jgi:hypothetical protein
MREIKKAQVLQDEPGMRIVSIAQDVMGTDVFELIAVLGAGLCTFTNTATSRKPKQFVIHPAEMDTLCAAWLQFRADFDAIEEEKKTQFNAWVSGIFAHAGALGADVEEDKGLLTYPNRYTLTWPENDALNSHWNNNDNLTLLEIESRLKYVEHVRAAHAEKRAEHLAPLVKRAEAVGGALIEDTSLPFEETCRYILTFSERADNSPFTHWQRNEKLTMGMVRGRLTAMENHLEIVNHIEPTNVEAVEHE